MAVLRHQFEISTSAHHEIIDITHHVEGFLIKSKISEGLCNIYTPHATAAITINENADPNIGVDFQHALEKIIIEHDGWLHDRIDNNAAAHIKSAIIGPSECIPIQNSRLSLGTWQNVFYCEFDGPRSNRQIILTILS